MRPVPNCLSISWSRAKPGVALLFYVFYACKQWNFLALPILDQLMGTINVSWCHQCFEYKFRSSGLFLHYRWAPSLILPDSILSREWARNSCHHGGRICNRGNLFLRMSRSQVHRYCEAVFEEHLLFHCLYQILKTRLRRESYSTTKDYFRKCT